MNPTKSLVLITALFSNAVFAFPKANPVHGPWTPPAAYVTPFADNEDLYKSYDVLRYDLKISFDPVGGTLAGRNAITFKATTDQLGTLILDAVDMQIKEVLWQDGSPLLTTYDDRKLSIALPHAMPINTLGKVTVVFASQRPQSLILAHKDQSRSDRSFSAYTFTEPDGSRDWFPCHDIPSDKTITKMEFTVPSGFVVSSNGDELGVRNHRNGSRTFRFHTGKPITTYLTSVVLSQMQTEKMGSWRNVPLSISAPSYLMSALRHETARTPKMMAAFEHFTQTAYGFQKYSQTVAEGYSSSMEHQSATTMGGRHIVGDGTGEGVVAHELAHQWFGDLVTCSIWGELWLNEGFASYLPIVFYNSVGEYNTALYQHIGNRGWYFAAVNAENARPLSTKEEWPKYNNFDHHSYAKGAMVIHLMRQVANAMVPSTHGVEAYSRALRLYFREHSYANVRNTDLRSALERVTHRSWERFFNEWVLQAGHPEVAASWAWEKGELKLTLKQDQVSDPKKKWGSFSFPLEVKILHLDGSSSVQMQWVTETEQTLTFIAKRPVRAVILDPNLVVPGTFKVAQSPDAFADAYAVAKNSSEREAILGQFFALLPPNSVDTAFAGALNRMIANSTNPMSLAIFVERLKRDDLLTFAQQVVKKSHDMAIDPTLVGDLGELEYWVHSKITPDQRPTFDELVQRWNKAERVTAREQLIQSMHLVDVEATHRFAAEQLRRRFWTDRDRISLVSILAKNPTETSKPIIRDLLDRPGTANIAGPLFSSLNTQKYADPEIITLLQLGAKNNRDSGLRANYVKLLAFQTSQKDLACKILLEVADVNQRDGTATDRATVLPEVKKSQTALGCP